MKKKIIIFITLFIFSISVSNAQYLLKGTNVISGGIGIGSAIGTFSHSSQSPGLNVQYERGVWDVPGPGVVSLGGYLGSKRYRYKNNIYTENWHYTVIGVTSAYHYNDLKRFNNKFLDKLDVYGGILLSWNILNYSNNYPSNYYHEDYKSNIEASLYVGGRYFFNDNFAVYTELGFGVSVLNIGASFKF